MFNHLNFQFIFNCLIVFRVKKPDEFNRPRIEPSDRLIPRKKSYSSKKVIIVTITALLFYYNTYNIIIFQGNKRKRGVIKSRPVVVKGQRS